jgi:5-(carboxyamino)imidazole ribonucleotide synthase
MKQVVSSDFRLGILGGGQLGKMLCLAAHNWDVQTWVLDESKAFPCGTVASHFVEGSFKDYEAVYQFGKQVDVLTIEIEHVNLEALEQLEAEGKIIHPKPSALKIIQDKGLQKQFFAQHQIPTSPFQLYASPSEIKEKPPFVWKSRTGGYDGRGVAIVKSADDVTNLPDVPCLVEQLVPIHKELAVIVARNEKGETSAFPAVEMAFNPDANLVEMLFCPANISPQMEQEAEALALKTIEAFDLCGLLAVELFLDENGALLVNEVAPRPHNSGHHSIDACITSQFEQHLRAVLNLPLGDTTLKMPAAMVNLLGADGHKGDARYEGLDDVLAISGVKLHLYGKRMTAPFRKMGHATVLDHDLQNAIEKAQMVQEKLRIVA